MSDMAGARRLGDWLKTATAEQALILTGSRRLARELLKKHERNQVARGLGAWQTPAILYWQDWLAGMLNSADGEDVPRLVDSHASTWLWERQLARYVDSGLVSPAGLVRQARTAWQRLNEWGVPVDEVARRAGAPEERAFARAAGAYAAALDRHGWIDGAGLARWVLERLEDGTLEAPGRVYRAGFDRTPPILDRLLEALRGRGATLVDVPPPAPGGRPALASHVDDEAEYRAAGAWARRVLGRNPDARIAIVSAELEARGADYARLVREGLAPGWQLGGAEHAHSVNVSYGRRFADFPAIYAALRCLRWTHRPLPARDVGLLLRSPFIAGGDRGGRARLELSLRRMPERPWPAAGLIAAVTSDEPDADVADWLRGVSRIAALGRSREGRRRPSWWAGRFDRLLTDLGWAATTPLGSEEFQLVNRWRELLNDFAALDVVGSDLSLAEAVGRLTNMAGDVVYQPETGAGLVSLLGPLEAAGMEFDALWLAGMDASRWPPASHPLALVSRRLQRAHGMPDATPQDTVDYAQRVVRRLLDSAAEVRISHARTQDDAALIASTLLDQVALTEATAADPGWHANERLGTAPGVTVESDPAPPVSGEEKVQGGAYTVQRQSTDPFTAFAVGRLGVAELRRYEPGLTASLRGTVVHGALEALYRDLPSQAGVAAWTEAEVRRRVDSAADRAVGRHLRHADGALERLLGLERARLGEVLRTLLAFERERAAFRIESVEERIHYAHAGVALELRADRIDRLPDGSLLIIDYKTGALKNLLDRDGNPADLQLVVYSLAVRERVGGLALFNVDRRRIVPRAAGGGIERRTESDEPWPERLAAWQARTRAAIEAIGGGDVRVNLRLGSEQSRPFNVLSRSAELRRAL